MFADISMDSAAVTPSSKLPERLPTLRSELQLHSSYPEADGSPAWVILDPLINGFHRIGWREYQVLKYWSAQSPAQLIQRLQQHTTLRLDEDELLEVYQFLVQHQLVQLTDEQRQQRTIKLLQGQDKYLQKALHNYLFFRLPLMRPIHLLGILVHLFTWCNLPRGLTLVFGSAILGFILTLLNWDLFWATLTATFTPVGMIGYLVALTVTKAMHEMGHALVATRYGLRVSHMGVIFILGWPLLYTDTNEAWKLKSRRQRLCIDSAGILTELFIAGLATIAWHLTEQADAKQVFFYLATTSWVLTLLLNISPFMRFDGYFVLSDWLRYPNLHERSFSTAKVFLRRKLLGWDEPYDEPNGFGKRASLVSFAIMIWLYRLVVFTGIAIAVYTFFFKLLGILLFIIEMYWFVLKPIIKELAVWQQGWRARTNPMRKTIVVLILVGLASLLFIPLTFSTTLYGHIQPQQGIALYAPAASQLIQLPSGQTQFHKGDVIYRFDQPELIAYSKMADARIESLSYQLKGLSGIYDGEQQRRVLQQLTALVETEKSANNDKRAKLVIRAPFDGQLTDVPQEYRQGDWVATGQALGYLMQPSKWQAVFYADESQLRRLSIGAQVQIRLANRELHTVSGTVTGYDRTPVKQLPYPMLSTRYGGELSVMESEEGLTPRDRLFRIFVDIDAAPDLHMTTAHGVIDLQPISLFDDVIKPAMLKLVQQLNF